MDMMAWTRRVSIRVTSSIFLFLAGLGANLSEVSAQIVPDATLENERSQVIPRQVQGIDRSSIEGGSQRGENLFHSFRDFSIPTGESVLFNNSAQIRNILTRVTGGSISNIDGWMGANGSANLYLLNPNGIVFGPNASLNIRGSFFATTATSFRLPNGSEYSATNPQAPPLLNLNLVPGIQFGASSGGATITNRGSLIAGQDLNLIADKLDLQGTLLAGRNLTLLATDTVTARDSTVRPFVAAASGDLLLQGDKWIDIAVLKHPGSGLSSGGNLVLRSNSTIGGDAHFSSGRNFSVERLDGSLGNLSSPNDPVILTNGYVTLGNYTGASLHILAGGSVTLGTVTITGTGDVASTISPSNTTLFNGSKTYADLATFNLTDYKATLNSDGTVRSVDPVMVPITTNGSTQATLDVRAGVDWAKLGGLPTTPVVAGVGTPATTAIGTASSANITVTGNIRVDQPAGLVLLTNQFSPNTLPGTIAIQGNVDTSTTKAEANGGDIWVYGRGDIEDGFPIPGNVHALLSSSFSSSGNAGNGGAISFATNLGNINLNYVQSLSKSFSSSGNVGNGGAISFATNLGNINITNSPLSSDSNSGLLGASDSGNAGNGGAISFTANSGNINLSNSYSSSSSFLSSSSGNAGNGGMISFATHSGNIDLKDSYSYALSSKSSSSGNAGNGGMISFATHSGNISLTKSDSYSDSLSYSPLGNAGNGGTISFATHSGNINLINSNSDSGSFSGSGSGSGNSGNGGAISFTSNSGNIDLTSSDLSSASFSQSGNAGNGGTINLSARGGTISGSSSLLSSFAISNLGESGNSGKITLEAGREVSGLIINTIASGGKSGDVQINGFGNLLIDHTSILTAQQVDVKKGTSNFSGCGASVCEPIKVTLSDKGQAGNVTVDSIGNLTFSNSVFQSDTRGGKPAGNIAITSLSVVSFTNSQITSNASGSGKAGDITINAPTIKVNANSQIRAETTKGSSGQGGNITVNAPTAVALTRTADGIPVISVESSGAGQAGDITINTPQLTLSDAAKITATATKNSTNLEGGGSVTLNASNINLAGGTVGVFAETNGKSPAGRLTLKPYNDQPNLNLLFQPGSLISAATSSSGQGGDLVLSAPQVINLDGPGTLSVATEGSGKAGNVLVTAPQINMTNGVSIFGTTNHSGQGGSVVINSNQVRMADGSIIAVNSGSSDVDAGDAGNLIINSGILTLDRNASLKATSENGKGGDISLNLDKYLLLRRNSLISTSAGANNQGTADGGNIAINTQFIIAPPWENSDIAANAFGGTGGKVNINAEKIFGMFVRSRSDLIRLLGSTNPKDLDPIRLGTSDITAISQNNPTLNGSVAVSQLEVDPTRGLNAEPLRPQKPNVAEDCGSQNQTKGSRVTSSGRGGITPTPGDSLTGSTIWQDPNQPLATPPGRGIASSPPPEETSLPIAQGWVQKSNGNILLVGTSSPTSPTPACHVR